jgi:hypothetical protein
MNAADESRDLPRTGPLVLSGLGSFGLVFLTWTLSLWVGGVFTSMPGVVAASMVVIDFMVVLALVIVSVRLILLPRRRLEAMILLLGTVVGWLAFGCLAVYYGSRLD